MKEDLDELYRQLGIVSYNLELHKMILQNLDDSKQELLAKIQDSQIPNDKNIEAE